MGDWKTHSTLIALFYSFLGSYGKQSTSFLPSMRFYRIDPPHHCHFCSCVMQLELGSSGAHITADLRTQGRPILQNAVPMLCVPLGPQRGWERKSRLAMCNMPRGLRSPRDTHGSTVSGICPHGTAGDGRCFSPKQRPASHQGASDPREMNGRCVALRLLCVVRSHAIRVLKLLTLYVELRGRVKGFSGQ